MVNGGWALVVIVVAREWLKTRKWAKCSFLGDGVGQVDWHSRYSRNQVFVVDFSGFGRWLMHCSSVGAERGATTSKNECEGLISAVVGWG